MRRRPTKAWQLFISFGTVAFSGERALFWRLLILHGAQQVAAPHLVHNLGLRARTDGSLLRSTVSKAASGTPNASFTAVSLLIMRHVCVGPALGVQLQKMCVSHFIVNAPYGRRRVGPRTDSEGSARILRPAALHCSDTRHIPDPSGHGALCRVPQERVVGFSA